MKESACMKTFTDLKAWQVGMDLVEEVFGLSCKFPKSELYGLTQQIRRSSMSVVSNIAEGFGRYTYPDKANRYTIARGECTEVLTQIIVAARLKFITEKEAERALQLSNEVGRMLSGLITSCKNRS